MSKLSKKMSTAKTGYYGPLTFLDTQEEFNYTFGIQPRMYTAFGQDEESHDAQRDLDRFIDACHIDVFISICQMDYVGTDTAATTFYIQVICRLVSAQDSIFGLILWYVAKIIYLL